MAKQTVLDNDASAQTNWPTLHVPIADIHFNPELNSRRVKSTPDEIRKLADDIKANKQLFPLLVIPRGENGTVAGEANGGYVYEGVDGERRYAALKLLAESDPDVQAFIRVLPSMDEAKLYATSMKANDPTLRKEPNLIDLAGNVIQLKAQGKSGKEIAAAMGKSAGWVSDAAKLTGLRPEIQKRIADRTIPWSLARVLSGMEDEAAQDTAIAALDASVGGKVSAVASEHRKAKPIGKSGKKRGRKAGKGGKDRTERAGVSVKVAIKAFAELAAAPVKDEETGKQVKETKAETAVREVFGLVGKFMLGRLKQTALAEKVLELL